MLSKIYLPAGPRPSALVVVGEISLLLQRLPGHGLSGDLPDRLWRGGGARLVPDGDEAPHHPGPPALLLPVVLDAVEAAVRAVALTAVPHHTPAGRVGEGGGLTDLLPPGGQRLGVAVGGGGGDGGGQLDVLHLLQSPGGRQCVTHRWARTGCPPSSHRQPGVLLLDHPDGQVVQQGGALRRQLVRVQAGHRRAGARQGGRAGRHGGGGDVLRWEWDLQQSVSQSAHYGRLQQESSDIHILLTPLTPSRGNIIPKPPCLHVFIA